jgi:hypothetical protein
MASVNHIVKPPAESSRRQSALKCAAIFTALLLGSFPAGARPPICQRELGATDLALIKSVLHLRGVAHALENQQCAAYHQQVTR